MWRQPYYTLYYSLCSLCFVLINYLVLVFENVLTAPVRNKIIKPIIFKKHFASFAVRYNICRDRRTLNTPQQRARSICSVSSHSEIGFTKVLFRNVALSVIKRSFLIDAIKDLHARLRYRRRRTFLLLRWLESFMIIDTYFISWFVICPHLWRLIDRHNSPLVK